MFSRPTCLAPFCLFASVPPCSVSKSVANMLGTSANGRRVVQSRFAR